MCALSKIEAAGFKVSLTGDSLAIAPASSLTQPQREFLKNHKAEIINELKAVTLPKLAEQRILAYLAHIGETDQALINEFLERCRRDQAVPAWVINWTDQQPKIKETAITCQHCQHFDSFNTHGGAGLCKVGAFTAGICRWSDTGHQCGSYLNITHAETGKRIKNYVTSSKKHNSTCHRFRSDSCT